MISGSIENYRIETTKRLGVLYNKHHSWLMACAYNKSKDIKVSEDLVQDLFLYLGEKNNPKIYYRDSFNLLYCHQFLSSRYINYIKSRIFHASDITKISSYFIVNNIIKLPSWIVQFQGILNIWIRWI